jgi:tetratricopeptide (TPR) repeat protein
MSFLAETMQTAVAHHQAGRFSQAEQLYRQVLAADPQHAGAIHLLGLIALQVGRPEVAVQMISTAIRLSGNQAVFHANLGEAFRALGRLDEARRSYEQAITIQPNLAPAHNNLGTILQAQGNLPAALEHYRQAVALQSDYVEAFGNLGTAYQQQGNWQAAAEAFERAVAIQPRNARGHYNRGVALATQSQLGDAIAAFEQAIAIEPGYADAHYGLGMTLQRHGDLQRAEAAYQQALSLRPQWAEAASSLGSLYQAQGDLSRASQMYQRALEVNPRYAEALYNQGTVLKRQDQPAAAMEKYRQAIAYKPDFPEAHYNLGTLLQQAERLDEAAAAYCEAVRLRPDYTLAHNNLGNVYRDQGRIDEAIASYERALQIEPSSSSAQSNLGTVWQQQGQLERTLACYERAMQANPDSAEVFNNLGTALEELGRDEEALACFDRSAQLAPETAEPRYNRALLHLSRRRFAEGWADYGAWLQCKKYGRRPFDAPLWNGVAMDQGTLLVYAEQGFGDTLQFVRYLPLIRQLVQNVVLEVQPALVPLMRASGFNEVHAGGDRLPHYDAHSPLMQLPAVFGSTEETMPAEVPYLATDPALVEKWRARMDDFAGFKIGITWQGNPKYSGDARRSIPLMEFAPLAAVPGVRLLSLQKGQGAEQLAAASDRISIVDLACELDLTSGAFMDTAAVMQSLDLMITSDTATAHLAGALGVPTWVALSNHPDWRWFREGDRSPWYPTLRLFRQQRPGDWGEVFARMADELGRISKQSP